MLSTWETSFEAIEHSNPAAARLFILLAFVNFEDILDKNGVDILAGNYAFTANGAEAINLSDRPWRSFLSAGQTWTIHDLESAFEALQWRSHQKSHSTHKLVHVWGHDRLEVEQQRQLSVLALELMADATAHEGADPSHQVRLVPHKMSSFAACSQLYEAKSETA